MLARGLTLLELLVTIAILAILVSIGIPSFTRQIASSRTLAATDQLLQAVQLARTTAIAKNRGTTIKKAGNWEAGWSIFYDENMDGVQDANDQVITTGEVLQSVLITATGPLANHVSFLGTGQSRSGGSLGIGSFTICPTDNGQGYKLILSASGRLRREKIDAGDC